MPLDSCDSCDDNGTASVFASKLSPAADTCVGLAILCVAAVSILGNGLVLLVCYRRRKRMAASELLCANLAAADFLCCVCFYPLSILSSFRHAWLGRRAACVYYGLGCFVCGLSAGISVSVKTRSSRARGASVRAACGSIWLLAAAWSSLPLFGWGRYVPEPYGLSCTVAWRRYRASARDAVYVLCSFACFTLVPVLLIVASQCRILCEVSRFSSSLAARGVRHGLRRTEKRLSVMFFCISLGFVVAWAPYAVVSFLFIFHQDHRYMAPGGFVLPALFAKSSHVYNPFIYFYFNRTFQRELRGLCPPLCPRPGGNRVGVRAAPAPCPIHIQLRERGAGRGARSCRLSQDRTYSESRSSGGPAFTCWGSMPKNIPTVSPDRPARDSLPVSI